MAAWRASQNNQLRWLYAACDATIALAAGDSAAALGLLAGHDRARSSRPTGRRVRRAGSAFPAAIEAAACASDALGEAGDLLSLLAGRPPGHVPPYLRAQLARGYGLLAAARGDVAPAESQLRAAIDGFGSLGFPYWLAQAQTDLADAAVRDDRPAEATPLLDEARDLFVRLGAAPALERAEALLADEAPVHWVATLTRSASGEDVLPEANWKGVAMATSSNALGSPRTDLLGEDHRRARRRPAGRARPLGRHHGLTGGDDLRQKVSRAVDEHQTKYAMWGN